VLNRLHKYKWLIIHHSGIPDAWYLNKHKHEWNWPLLQYYSLHWSQLVQFSLVCWLCVWCWPASSAHHSEPAAQGQGSCGIAVPLTHLTSVPWFRILAVRVVLQIMGQSPTSHQHIRQVTQFHITNKPHARRQIKWRNNSLHIHIVHIPTNALLWLVVQLLTFWGMVTAHPVTQHHIPEDFNFQLPGCEKNRSYFRNDVWRNLSM
jgi:hypothetical protein